MRLYAGSSTGFIQETAQGHIADRLSEAFFRAYRYPPSPSEEQSWRNSLRAMGLVMQDAHLDDQGVLLEYELPLSSSRLDCLVTAPSDASRESDSERRVTKG